MRRWECYAGERQLKNNLDLKHRITEVVNKVTDDSLSISGNVNVNLKHVNRNSVDVM